MRLNKYIATATGLSRRAADDAVYRNRVLINGALPSAGQQVAASDNVSIDGNIISLPTNTITIMLNKPVDYICSREGQGGQTIYELLPSSLQILKSIGRLDKNSSGLLLLTTDGELAQQLTHPKYEKIKCYVVMLDKPLAPLHHQMICDHGIQLPDGRSQLQLSRLPVERNISLNRDNENNEMWQVTMQEGRNRQIRRTFEALGYDVVKLHRTLFGGYQLGNLASGEYKII